MALDEVAHSLEEIGNVEELGKRGRWFAENNRQAALRIICDARAAWREETR